MVRETECGHRDVAVRQSNENEANPCRELEGIGGLREYLCPTVSVDHNIVDGAPLAHFVVRLQNLIECCYGPAVALASSL